MVQAWQGKSHTALPLLKRALARFGALDDPRMHAGVSIVLGQVLVEAQQPRHAVLLLQRAFKQATVPEAVSHIDPEEWEGLRFALLRGLGLAYQAEGQLDRALSTYQQALEREAEVVGILEYSSLFAPCFSSTRTQVLRGDGIDGGVCVAGAAFAARPRSVARVCRAEL